MRLARQLGAWLRSPRCLWAAASVALLLALLGLDNGFVADDRGLLGRLRSEPLPLPFWNLFTACKTSSPIEVLGLIYTGFLPWWASPRLSLAFFRPLAVASHYLDSLLWPDSPALMHLHNALLYGLVAALAAALYRRWLGPGWAAGLAALLYAVDEAHIEGATWIASRNTLLTACFVLGTLLLYDRHLRLGGRAALVFAALLLLCAHASSEGAVAVWGYLLPYALWLDQGPWRARAAKLAPLLLVTLAWQALYRGLGYGMYGSGLYVDPADAPLYFATVAPGRLLVILREQLVLPPLAFLTSVPAPALLAMAIVLTACAAPFTVRALRASPAARACAAGMVLSAVPICAALPSPRLYFLSSFGAFGLIALVIAQCAAAQGGGARTRAGRALAALAGGALLLLHGPLALAQAPAAASLTKRADLEVRRIVESLPWGEEFAGKALLVLNTPNYYTLAFAHAYREGPGPLGPFVFGASARPVRVSRIAHDTLRLEPEGSYLDEPWTRLVRRPDEPFPPDYRVPVGAAWIGVEALTAAGHPRAVRIVLPEMDDPRFVWTAWNDREHRYERVALPAVGEKLLLPGL
jgi:hypothetical protein